MISQPCKDLEFMQETNMILLVRFKRIISFFWGESIGIAQFTLMWAIVIPCKCDVLEFIMTNRFVEMTSVLIRNISTE